jgi:hypothetical protein
LKPVSEPADIEPADMTLAPLASAADAVWGECEHAFGPCLLTVNRLQRQRIPLRLARVYSSNPSAYPVGGYKDKPDSGWTRQVLIQGEPYVGEGQAALAWAFDDHARIVALGLRCVINQPLIHQAQVIGTLNLLATGERWPKGALERIGPWAQRILATL